MTTEQRIEKLENELISTKRQNKTLFTGVCLLVAFLTLTWTGLSRLTPAYAQNTPLKEVRAKEFILEDENGNIRASLVVSKGVPSLSLMNENGEPLAMLAVSKKGPVLTLCDINGKIRFMQSVSKDGSAMKFYDENGKTRAGMIESGLFLLDENENRRAMLNFRNGGSSLGLYGDGKTLAGLTVLRGDRPRLILTDENGARQPIK